MFLSVGQISFIFFFSSSRFPLLPCLPPFPSLLQAPAADLFREPALNSSDCVTLLSANDTDPRSSETESELHGDQHEYRQGLPAEGLRTPDPLSQRREPSETG